jgi:hypothetical protein
MTVGSWSLVDVEGELDEARHVSALPVVSDDVAGKFVDLSEAAL